jgi:hypothetical protein
MPRKKTGSVYQKPAGSGIWYYKITLRDGTPFAEKVPPRASGRPVDEAYAKAYRDDRLDAYNAGSWDPRGPKEPEKKVYSVLEFAREWNAKQTYVSAAQELHFIERWLAPHELGAMEIREGNIRPRHIKAWVEWLKERPAVRGGKLAPRTVRTIYGVIYKLFAVAVEDELLPVSPCQLRKGVLPSIRDKEPGARKGWRYPREEALKLIFDPRLPLDRRVLYAIPFCGGPRFGEDAALKWCEYHPELKPLGGFVVAYSFNERKKIRKETKTEAVKMVPVHPVLAELLAEWREAWPTFYGREPTPEDFIVPRREDCQPRVRRRSFEELRRDCATLGLPFRQRAIHSMRNTFITIARDDGALKDNLQWITHAPPGTMIDSYDSPDWRRLCDEVLKLKIERPKGAEGATGESRPHVAPKAGEGRGIATGNATAGVRRRKSRVLPSRSALAAGGCGGEGAGPYLSSSVLISGSWKDGSERIAADSLPIRPGSATAVAIPDSPYAGEAALYFGLELAILRGEFEA